MLSTLKLSRWYTWHWLSSLAYVLKDIWNRGGFHRSMSRFSSRRSVWQEESFISFVQCTVLSSSFSNDRANGQHNTVVQGKYIAATSWLCVLFDNTTVDNVYIDMYCMKPWVTDWLNEIDELQTKCLVFFFLEICFPVSHWLKFDDSVLDSAYDWLALSPLHHSDN